MGFFHYRWWQNGFSTRNLHAIFSFPLMMGVTVDGWNMAWLVGEGKMATMFQSNNQWQKTLILVLGGGAFLSGLFAVTAGVHAQPVEGFADPAFKQVWQRTDQPVEQGK